MSFLEGLLLPFLLPLRLQTLCQHKAEAHKRRGAYASDTLILPVVVFGGYQRHEAFESPGMALQTLLQLSVSGENDRQQSFRDAYLEIVAHCA